MIVDDVFSSLDRTTQRRVWDRVFGLTGLLRRQGSAAVLATHFLDHLDQSDHVVVLGGDGHIASQGAFSEVKDSAFLKDLLIPESPTNDGEAGAVAGRGAEKPDHNTGRVAQDEIPGEGEDLLRSGGDVSLYAYWFRSIGWSYSVLALVLGITGTFFQIFPGRWYSRRYSLPRIDTVGHRHLFSKTISC